MQSKNAVGNLIKKYSAVLKKCAWLNACVLTGAVMCGSVGNAWAATELGAQLDPMVVDTNSGVTSDNATNTYTISKDITLTDNAEVTDAIIINGGAGKSTLGLGGSGDSLLDIDSGGELTLQNITITGKTVSGTSGTVIYSYEGTLTIENSDFIGNHGDITSMGSGAIWNSSGTITSITGGTFSGNSTTKTGGAIYSTGNAEYGTGEHLSGDILKISGVTFGGDDQNDANTAEKGGAIANGANSIIGTIEGSLFINNSATNIGGAIYNDSATIDSITSIGASKTIFEYNKANAGGQFIIMVVLLMK